MPNVITCEACNLILDVSGFAARQVVACPHCGGALAVPAATDIIQATLAEPLAAPTQRTTQRFSVSPAVAVAILAVTGLVGVVIVGGGIAGAYVFLDNRSSAALKDAKALAWPVAESRDDKAELLAEQRKYALTTNQMTATLDQVEFWQKKGGVLTDLINEAEQLKKRSNAIKNKIEARLGSKMNALEPQIEDTYQHLRRDTTPVVAANLATHGKAFEEEIEGRRAQIDIKFPLPEYKIFDLSTVGGQNDYNDFQIRYPAQRNLALANRKVEAAQLVTDRFAICEKWANKCHAENKTAIARIEKAIMKK